MTPTLFTPVSTAKYWSARQPHLPISSRTMASAMRKMAALAAQFQTTLPEADDEADDHDEAAESDDGASTDET